MEAIACSWARLAEAYSTHASANSVAMRPSPQQHREHDVKVAEFIKPMLPSITARLHTTKALCPSREARTDSMYVAWKQLCGTVTNR